jgi:outer membrane receptor protein involved in Fe transport
VRVALVWAPTDALKITPSFYYQDRYRNDVESYWNIYSNPGSNRFVNADPTQRTDPDQYWISSLKVEGDFGAVKVISSTSYFNRREETGYEGTLYNLGFYQTFLNGSFLTGPALLDGTGIHLPTCAQQAVTAPGQPCLTSYRSPASIDNGQDNFAQEIRLQGNDPDSKLSWTAGLFFGLNHQSYLEQIHDPQLNALTEAVAGVPYGQEFYSTDAQGNSVPTVYDPRFPNDSYFLSTQSTDKQTALFGEGVYSFTDQWKLTLGARFSRTEFAFSTLTGGPQLFLPDQANSGDKKENSFTPKVSLDFQADPHNLYYFTYAKGFRPGGANNPVPQAACATDFANFGITASPATYNSDTVDSYEIGAKNNLDNRIKIASSLYYIKWNNIQQTVIPPICQISFIDNLGQATAKGIDLQADIAVTDDFTAEIATGYTQARYSQSSQLSATSSTGPVVSAGDAITGQSGQPTAPFTFTLGLEYKFQIASLDWFARVDDEYQGKAKWPAPSQDSTTLQYDANNYTVSSTNFASFRTGTTLGGWQVAAFVDNLTDTHTVTNYLWSINPNVNSYPTTNAPGSPYYSRLERDFTFRPRTFGLTFTYRSH